MAVKQVFNTSAELDFPNVLPTLDLDFANSKTLDPRITFTRSSGGSYVGADGLIKLAGVNEARFDHDPVTGESLGLLVEESRTNLLLRSEEFDITWGKASSNLIPNQATSPNGTFTADKLIPNDTFTRHYAQQTLTITANATYTFSCFAKAAELNFASVIFGMGSSPFTRGGIIINLTTGEVSNYTVGTPLSVVRHPVQYYGNGWWKISVSVLIDTTTTFGYVEVGASSLSTNYSGYRGDNASGIYIWGAQLEQGAFPTSYIPTKGSTRTRAVDIAQITGKNFSDFFNPTEGAVFVDFKTTGVGIVLNIDNGGFPNRIQFSNTSGIAYVRDSTIIINNSHPSTPSGLNFKYATSYSDNKYIITRNGISISYPLTTEFRGGPPIGLANMRLGSYHGIAAKHNGFIRRVIYYPKFLSKEQHQALTS
jgi:hypothetical protein